MHRQEGGATPSKLQLPVSFLDAPPHPKVDDDTAVPCYCPISLSDPSTLLSIITALTRALFSVVSCTGAP